MGPFLEVGSALLRPKVEVTSRGAGSAGHRWSFSYELMVVCC